MGSLVDVQPAIVPLRESQILAASEVLGRAFQNDPLAVYMLPDPVTRRRLLPYHFEVLVRYGHLAEKVWTTESVEGVMVCQPPGHSVMDENAMIQSGMTDEANRVGKEEMGRFESFMRALEPLRSRDAGARHWYVMGIGVDPLKHGRGVGTALLKHVASLADSQQLPCYLETAGPQNVQFYQKNGYRIVVDDVEPLSVLRYWTFKREAGPI